MTARNNEFGARGSSDEKGGNSTYTVRYAGNRIKVTKYMGYLNASNEMVFTVSHHGKVIGNFKLNERNGSELKAVLDVNHGKFEFKDGKKMIHDSLNP